jgi:transketolase
MRSPGEAAPPGNIGEEDLALLRERVKRIRNRILTMIFEAGSGHPGGSLSCVEILSCLYFHAMRHRPGDPLWEDRDRFILSKGHAAPALYATLAESGYIPRDLLPTLRKFGSPLQGHPDRKVPGVEVSTGSLGQGLSIGCGVALAARSDRRPSRTFVLLGDGECDEGQVWEAAMFGSHYKLDNLTAIVDRNGLQIDGLTEKILRLEPLAAKWKAFGWHVIERDGHRIPEILDGLREAGETRGRPSVLIAHTFKGKGVSFMEWINAFHGRALTRAEMDRALGELNGDSGA